MLDLYDVGDQQQTQYTRTITLAETHLNELKGQRAELDEAIRELSDQLEWGRKMLASMDQDEAAE